MKENIEEVVLGGGCFWCTEAVFRGVKGVVEVRPGYSGGHTENPTYEEVCTGTTGHAEVCLVKYDPSKISFREILEVFFDMHDPTSLNRQGDDIGTQYRSIILYTTEEQRQIAQNMIDEINRQLPEGKKVVTELQPLKKFYPAEDYHVNYFERNPHVPYCRIVISPKVKKVREKHAGKFKD